LEHSFWCGWWGKSMCAGVSFKLKANERDNRRGKKVNNVAVFQDGEDSEREEETVVEQVEEYEGPPSPRPGATSTNNTSVVEWDNDSGTNEMACSLSQVLRRKKRTAVENSDELKVQVEAAAPEVSKEDYERVPVESFGKVSKFCGWLDGGGLNCACYYFLWCIVYVE